jgi:cytochrome c peroxidase
MQFLFLKSLPTHLAFLKTKNYIYLLLYSFTLFAFRQSVNDLFVSPKYFPKPVYDFSKNPLRFPKIQLGRTLFYDPILSSNNTISCASCHSQYSAFTHVDHALSHGINDKIGFRNAPALMNLAWQKTFMYDGAIHHLDVQSLAPITNPVEMNETITNVVAKLQTSKRYPTLFYKAFGDSIITGEYTLKAIAQFMLTLVSNNAKYDSVQRKQATFNAQEKNGYLLFKKNCAVCHQEPLFSNGAFLNNGLAVDASLHDFGRMRVTQNTNDSLKFKVPTLRNIEFSYPYMHDGRFKKLSQVLNHYTNEIIPSKTLASELQQPIILSSNEKVDIIAFLLTLSDKTFLFDKKFSYLK